MALPPSLDGGDQVAVTPLPGPCERVGAAGVPGAVAPPPPDGTRAKSSVVVLPAETVASCAAEVT